MKTIYDHLTADDVYGALFTHGGDPWLIDSEEDAQDIAEFINDATGRGEVKNDLDEDPEYGNFAVSMAQLDLTADNNPKHIYSFVNGSSGLICLADDWN